MEWSCGEMRWMRWFCSVALMVALYTFFSFGGEVLRVGGEEKVPPFSLVIVHMGCPPFSTFFAF